MTINITVRQYLIGTDTSNEAEKVVKETEVAQSFENAQDVTQQFMETFSYNGGVETLRVRTTPEDVIRVLEYVIRQSDNDRTDLKKVIANIENLVRQTLPIECEVYADVF